jgi:phage tail sheath protein FI
MPVRPTYPGVYIEEVPSGVRTIMGVSTSVTAFVGYTGAGPTDQAVQILSFGEFQRTFGGLHRDSKLSYVVQHFFQNGGSEAWIVRVASGSQPASIALKNGVDGAAVDVLRVEAASPGSWGNGLRLDVDYRTGNPDSWFNLTVTEYVERDGVHVAGRTESHRNLSMNPSSPGYVVPAVNSGSGLIRVSAIPAPVAGKGKSTSGDLSSLKLFTKTELVEADGQLKVEVDGLGAKTVQLFTADNLLTITSLEALAQIVAEQVCKAYEGVAGFSGFACTVDRSDPNVPCLVAASGTKGPASKLKLSACAAATRFGFPHDTEATGAAAPPAPATLAGTSLAGLKLCELGDLSNDHRRVAFRIDGGEWQEADLFPKGGVSTVPGPGLNEVAKAVASGINAVSNKKVTASAAATELSIESVSTGLTSSVELASASIHDAAAVLKLGRANGGREEEAAASIRPAQTGTVGADLGILNLAAVPKGEVTVDPGGGAAGPITIWDGSPSLPIPQSPEELAAALGEALHRRKEPALRDSTVMLVGGRLRVVAGGLAAKPVLTFGGAQVGTISLKTGVGVQENVSRYALGVGPDGLGAQTGAQFGADGSPPQRPEDIVGSQDRKTGMYALLDVGIFNILCLPDVTDRSILEAAQKLCEDRRAFLIIDPPEAVKTRAQAKTWMESATEGPPHHKNSAAYFPRIMVADPLDRNRVKEFPPCGIVAGVFARTDAERGVWKAPAGLDASLRGVRELACKLTDPGNDSLCELGLNCLRAFPAHGHVVWGARTLVGADEHASEWKYIPVRRLALFIEESLYRGTRWVVFEPNDEPLWAQIRLNVGAFMHGLFRQGAFQGRSPRQAYFVKCDGETTTQNDINEGKVNMLVGFAPLKPAEFVILKITQIAGEIQT